MKRKKCNHQNVELKKYPYHDGYSEGVYYECIDCGLIIWDKPSFNFDYVNKQDLFNKIRKEKSK